MKWGRHLSCISNKQPVCLGCLTTPSAAYFFVSLLSSTLFRPATIAHPFNRQRMQGMSGASSFRGLSLPLVKCQQPSTGLRREIGGRNFFDVFLEKNGKENGGKKTSFPLGIGSEKIAGTVHGRRKTVYIHTYIHTYIHAWNDAGIKPGGIVPRFCTGAWCAVRFQNVAADFFQDPARGCRGSQGSCNSSEWRGCRAASAVIARAMLELR
jgi:hypothetical protein